MEMKLAAVFAVLALFGAVAAISGFGNGGQIGASQKQNVTDSVRIAFMKAVHEGDYATAKALSGQYGIGGRMMKLGTEQMFSLRHQMQVKMDAGDYAGALEIQKQIGTLAKAQMTAKIGKDAELGKGFRMGFRAGKAAGRHPHAAANQTAATGVQ